MCILHSIPYSINYKLYLHITETKESKTYQIRLLCINYKLYLHITETFHGQCGAVLIFSINYKLYLHITETKSRIAMPKPTRKYQL